MRDEGRITRRGALQAAAGAAGLALLEASPLRAAARPPEPKARSVVEVWLAGGPSHLDTFDPKPEAGRDWCGPLDTPVGTNAYGVRIGQLLPLLAKQADKYSLIRSMSHGVNGHETAAYIVQTGRDPADRLVHPCLGAVVGMLRGVDHGYRGRVPPYVVLTASMGRFSETGFLGPRYRPFVTGGDPAQKRFAVEGIVAEGISDERQKDRRALLDGLDTLGKALPRHPRFEEFERCEEKAYELILGDAGKIFDLAQEKDEVRDRYGRTTFGQSCLVARRLVEAGVPYVTVNVGGWDTHKQNFESMRRKLPDLDRGLATLIQDLAERGLLSSTVVWCSGEFGRTPRVSWEPPWDGGRGHHGNCFTALVAGGGFRGGVVVGSTDARGEAVKDNPVHPRELHRAVYGLLGIDPDAPLPNGKGLDVKIAEPAAAGMSPLAEIL